jgi:hypothetical protein
MEISCKKEEYTVSGLSNLELGTVMYLLGEIREQCFQGPKNKQGEYLSGDGFFAVLTKDELKAFQALVDECKNKLELLWKQSATYHSKCG